MGAGLDFLLQTVVMNNGGGVTIFSLEGGVRFIKERNGIRSIALPNNGFCPGTTIDLTFRTDTIECLDEEPEELEW